MKEIKNLIKKYKLDIFAIRYDISGEWYVDFGREDWEVGNIKIKNIANLEKKIKEEINFND